RNLSERVAIRTEFLNAIVPGVGDPDVALSVQAQADFFIELAGCAATAAEHAFEGAVQPEDLYPLVAGVGDVHLARGIDGDGPRTPEDPWIGSRAALGITQLAPLAEEFAVWIEVLHAVVPRVGDVDIAVSGHGDAPRFLKLAVALSRPTPAAGDR